MKSCYERLSGICSSATESVKQILEEQRDMSNEQLNVTVVGMVQSLDRDGNALLLPSFHGEVLFDAIDVY
ncbi:hypothetical protein ACH5RR_034415 [Cinchona calisaya]|uniref:Uncharacterized protein n=1 Tax=Cinchona calisaya TaxID=153742 RepID=A0ABD2YEE6_9GENT